MKNLSLPHIKDEQLHDGQILRWPSRCKTCNSRECQRKTNEIMLCSYGYNYTAVENITLAGFICQDHCLSSSAKSKNIKNEKNQIISTHLVENQKSALRRISIAEKAHKQETKIAARDEFLNKESFRDEFILEIKEDILKGLSFVHDYKQINATIAQNINVIIETRYEGQDLEKKLEQATQQEQAIYWASKLLQEKLNVAKYLLNPEWITRESEKTQFRFHGLALKYVKLYKDLFKRKGITPSLNGNSYKNITANSEVISVIIQTLIDNAHKYSKKSGKVEIHISDQPDHILFSVGSYGPRILESERELIFHPFKRAKDAIKSQEEGAGYGLYISQLIARRIGTIIEVEQESQLKDRQGHWTTFTVRIPTNSWN
jgi:signal transduction histidine kinase